jgi:antitoxin component of RelBE/YafQ-DinJ toxin-antitoxin module
MNIVEFINEKYPIRDKVRDMMADPYKRIAEEDGLPYDMIGPDEDGNITKLVQVDDDGRNISVAELITLTPDDLKDDLALKNVYEIYMSQVTVEEVNLVDIMKSVEAYKTMRKSSEEAVGVLSL